MWSLSEGHESPIALRPHAEFLYRIAELAAVPPLDVFPPPAQRPPIEGHRQEPSLRQTVIDSPLADAHRRGNLVDRHHVGEGRSVAHRQRGTVPKVRHADPATRCVTTRPNTFTKTEDSESLATVSTE